MLIEELYKRKEINVRLYHICTRNNFATVNELRDYYSEYKTFMNLPNCGRKSNEELIDLCFKYVGDYFEEQEEAGLVEIEIEDSLQTIISKLTLSQREIINNFIDKNSDSLSVRCKNAISHYLNGNFNIRNFAAKKILHDSFDINKLKNVGAKSFPEIAIYISIIREYLIKVSQNDDEKYLFLLKNHFLIQRLFPNTYVPNEILESESIFLLTDFLLNENAIFDNTQTLIIKKTFKIYDEPDTPTLENIAKNVNLTRERVRQLRKLCAQNLFEKLSFIKNFDDDLLRKYNIEVNSNHVEIDEDIVFLINNKNKTNFTKEFIAYLNYVYLHDKFLLVGDIEDVLQINHSISRSRHSWENFYLIKKEIVQIFNFTAYANDIFTRINHKIDKTYSFNFKSYLSRFLKNNRIDLLDEIFPIAERIINREFNLYLNLHEELIFKRTTFKSAYEYAYEALEILDKPSTIKEINDKVSEINPSYDTSEAKIRAAMQRKKGFVPVGRKSIYGLKKWEKKRENFKGGSIRDIVAERLENSSRPLHIVELLNEVHKFREKTNEKNLLTNLKLDSNCSYLIFNQNFVGLTSKKHEYDLSKYKNIPMQLGKRIIGRHQTGHTVDDIIIYLNRKYNLSVDESKLIINNLDYFNESKSK